MLMRLKILRHAFVCSLLLLLLTGCGISPEEQGSAAESSARGGADESAGRKQTDPSRIDSSQMGEVDAEYLSLGTEFGEIVVRVDRKQAPITSREFLEHVRAGHLEGATFYRTVTLANQPGHPHPIEVIQGGRLPWIEGPDPDFDGFSHETTETTGLRHLDGTISMARDEPGSATTEFFICVGDQPALDFGGARNPDGQGFAAFGQVVVGMDVVRRIHAANETEQRLEPAVKIAHLRPVPKP